MDISGNMREVCGTCKYHEHENRAVGRVENEL